MSSFCAGVADIATAASSTIVVRQMIDAAMATGMARVLVMPRECRQRRSHMSMYAMANAIPTTSTIWERMINSSWSGARLGHHAPVSNPFHCGRETRMQASSAISSHAKITVKNLRPARCSPGEFG